MDYSVQENIVEVIFERAKYAIWPSKENNYECKFLQSNLLLWAVVLLLVVRVGTAALPINFSNNIFFADITKISLENFANQTRQSMGLAPLTDNSKLDEAARLKAQNMVANGYFDHTSPTGVTPWYWFSQVGYKYKYAGENLAIGFYESEEVFQAWLNSPSHKENLINPNYKEMGTAVLGGFGNNGSIIVVQLFGTQQAPKISAPVAKASQTPTVPSPVLEEPLVASEVIGSEEVIETPIASEIKEPSMANPEQRVLSQSIKFKSTIDSLKDNVVEGSYLNYINYVLYNYDNIIKNTVYGFSMILIGMLLSLIFFSPNMRFHKEFVLRSAVLMILLFAASFINKDLLLIIIPHQITI